MSWKSLTTRRGNKPTWMGKKKPVSVKVVNNRKKTISRRSVVNRVPRAFGNPVAQRTFAWLTYSELINTNSGAAGLDTDYVFNMNSIFDPNQSGIGHQPYGHDTYQTLYQRYRVRKFRYHIQYCTSNTPIACIAIAPLNNINTQTVVSLTEQQPALVKGGLYISTGDSSGVAFGLVDLQKMNGASKTEYDADDRFESNFGASPTELMGLHIVISGPAGAQTGFAFKVKLEYYVEMFDPIQLAQS